MNATDFIKHYGLNTARRIIEDSKNDDFWDTETAFYTDKNSESCVCLSELKHLVESVELVEHFGNDLVGAKQLLEFSNDCKTIELSGSVITVERLKQAIADYELIYGGEHV